MPGPIMKIESEVPFGHALYGWLAVHDLRLDALVKHDPMEKHYLAWETVRKQTNPFFEEGTGFEGYLVGRCDTPEAALETIVGLSQRILDAIARLYRFQYNQRSLLMKTLLRERADSEAIHIWSAYLGAELGRLRAQIIGSDKAQRFQNQTYTIIRALPPMIYHEVEHDIRQIYAVGAGSSARVSRLHISYQVLKPGQQDAWLVAENIGIFGHPLVRKFLDRG